MGRDHASVARAEGSTERTKSEVVALKGRRGHESHRGRSSALCLSLLAGAEEGASAEMGAALASAQSGAPGSGACQYS